MADRIGSGAVVAAGTAATCRNGAWNRSGNPVPHFDDLLDVAFQWMKPGATKVLWFQGHTVFNNTGQCSEIIAALTELGYSVTGSDITAEFTESLLALYDICVIPQMQAGGAGTGGAPVLSNAELDAIRNFVEGGMGLFIMDAADWYGHNYYRAQNQILENLRFYELENSYFGFQSDAIYDDVHHIGADPYRPIEDVDNSTEIGAAYQSQTGVTTVGVYNTCSMVKIGPGVVVTAKPKYRVGMPGDTLEYDFKVANTSMENKYKLTIELQCIDTAGWSPVLDNYSLGVVENGKYVYVKLSITIPDNTDLDSEDEITVTATTEEFADLKDSFTVRAHVGLRLVADEDTFASNQNPDDTMGTEHPNYIDVGRYQAFWSYSYLKWGDSLSEIPLDADILSAKLYLFCHYAFGSPPEIAACEVEDDSWGENELTWTNKPGNEPPIEILPVVKGTEDDPEPYYWDITPYFKDELAGDRMVSLCVRPLDNCPENRTRRFESKDLAFEPYWVYEGLHPFIEVIYTHEGQPKVSVSIYPSYRGGLPGRSLSYTVTVKNEGNVSDTYSLTTADNAGWSRTISPTSLSLAAGATGTATLTVTIPSGAENCTRDNVRVIATGTGVSAENSCIAHASTGPGVEVSISPTSRDGSPGAALTYTVTVTNTGGVADNYILTRSDNAGWSLSLSPSISLAVGASGTATLTVTIPTGAGNNVYDSVTVTATSQTDSSVSDSKSCTAHTVGGVVPENGVQVTISPASSSGNVGGTLRFSVTVKNNGTATDTFTLDASDTKSWGPTLSVTPPRVTLTAGASRTIVLTIKIPSTAAEGDSSTITVTATSQTDSTINGNSTCTATATAGGGISPLVYVVVAVVIIVAIVVILVIRPF